MKEKDRENLSEEEIETIPKFSKKSFGYVPNNYSLLRKISERDCSIPVLNFLAENTMSGLRPCRLSMQAIADKLEYARINVSRAIKKLLDLEIIEKDDEGNFLLNWRTVYSHDSFAYEAVHRSVEKKLERKTFGTATRTRKKKEEIPEPVQQNFPVSPSVPKKKNFSTKEEFWDYLSKSPYEPQDIFMVVKENGFFGAPPDKEEFIQKNMKARFPKNSKPAKNEMEFYRKKAEDWYEAIYSYEKKILEEF